MARKTTRRGALIGAGATIAAAAAVPAAAAKADPSFALIEAHRSAWRAYGAVLDEEGTIERKRFLIRQEDVCKILDPLEHRLLTEPARTLEGLRARIDYIRCCTYIGESDFTPHLAAFLAMLAASLDQVA